MRSPTIHRASQTMTGRSRRAVVATRLPLAHGWLRTARLPIASWCRPPSVPRKPGRLPHLQWARAAPWSPSRASMRQLVRRSPLSCRTCHRTTAPWSWWATTLAWRISLPPSYVAGMRRRSGACVRNTPPTGSPYCSRRGSGLTSCMVRTSSTSSRRAARSRLRPSRNDAVCCIGFLYFLARYAEEVEH